MVKEQDLRNAIADQIMEQPFHIPTYYADYITVDMFKMVLQERQRTAQLIRDHHND